MSIRLRKLSFCLGVEVCDADISSTISETDFGEIYRAFLAAGILLFRNQNITRQQHMEFSRRFGELDRHETLPNDRHPTCPEILVITNVPKADSTPSSTRNAGRVWHSDLSYTLVPSMASLLRGINLPDAGGDTMFANMYVAYEALSSGMKDLIANLQGVHMPGRKKADVSQEQFAEHQKLNPPVAQPLVRVHPETGRKALYVGEKVKRFDGMTEEESQPLLDYLCRHATRPEFVYRHQWRTNDVVVWDNRCTMHRALGDFDQSQHRYMERTTILGTPCGRLAETA